MAPKVDNQTDVQMFQLPEPTVQPPPVRDAEDDDNQDEKKITPEMLAELQTQLNEVRAHNEDLLKFVASRPGTTAEPRVVIPEPEPTVSFEGLPDPVTDRDGFLKGLTERTNAALLHVKKATSDASTAQATQMLQLQANRDRAWDLMRMHHPDLAANEKLIALASTEYTQELIKRGVNPDAALAQDTSGFVTEVANRAQQIVDDIRGAVEDIDDSSGDGRSMDMIGSQTNGTGRGAGKPKEQPGNFVQEIRKLQADLKIY